MTKKFVKKTMQITNLNEVGQTLEGTFEGYAADRNWVDKNTGEEKILKTVVFRQDDNSKIGMFEDGGLRNAIETSGIKPEQYVKIEFLGQKDLEGGKKVNQYDIYVAE